MTKLEVRIGSIEEAVNIHSLIPELRQPNIEEYKNRLNEKNLILIAYMNETPVGFKVGYDRYEDCSFYSWLGGVIPEYRNQGVAKRLATVQENWAKATGYKSIKFKTRNRFKNMLSFSISNGFKIVGFEEKEDVDRHRIILEKKL